jgi:glycosyltransferase involved in cell wall biosynthesis
VLRRARLVIAASAALAKDARRLGARNVQVIPGGVEIPERVAEPEEPPHVLFVGRLSQEKGILEFLAATDGLARVIVGDGPLRAEVPESVGLVPRERLGAFYERAAVVCVPSRREGFGMWCLEAMAHGRPVVTRATGGLRDLVADGVTGVLVRDDSELRPALESLLADPDLRRQMGDAARERVREQFSRERTAAELERAYEDSVTLSGS